MAPRGAGSAGQAAQETPHTMATQSDKAPADNTLDPKLLLKTLQSLRKGDFSIRMPEDRTGTTGKIYDTFNEVITLNQALVHELERISTVVGREGRINQRATLNGAVGSYQVAVEAVNSLIADLAQPTTEVAR